MHDLVIRNGTVIDGTGADRFVADVAVKDGKIAEVGRNLGPGEREIDADGMLVTPGFVDIHTHYDGQATWDPHLTNSSWHGVTTAVFGNCGVGFAPVRPGSERYLINLMEGVEDIPEVVLAEGLDFKWESIPDYLNTLESTPRLIDIGAQVTHGPLRFYVMGERGADHDEAPTPDEIDQMGRLLEQGLRAGALGFTTSRTRKHRAADGRPTPGLSADEAELTGLAQAMKRAGSGVIEVNSDFGPGEFETMRAAAEIAGRPLSVLLVQVNNDPTLWRKTLDQVGQAVREGTEARAQVGCRPIGVLMGLETSLNPFIGHPVWRDDLAAMAPTERAARLAADASLREKLLDESLEGKDGLNIQLDMAKTFELDDRLDYEPAPETSLVARAAAGNASARALALDAMLAHGGKGLLINTFENYSNGNLDDVHAMLTDPNSVMGVADSGAHVGIICDFSAPTPLLPPWGRDRTRGPKLPLEFLVAKHSRVTAHHYGLYDRGVIAPGLKADLNVIDFEALRLRRPEVVYDLPAGGKRLIQKADGYRHTFVAGQEIMRDGEVCDALPGKLIRGAQAQR